MNNEATKYKTAVRYSDFGAIGDGKTNDFEAILKAHTYANEHGLPVLGDTDKVYYISDTENNSVARTIPIMTNVDWQGAKFIIDDSELLCEEGSKRNYNIHIFDVKSPYEKLVINDSETLAKIGKINFNTNKINLELGYPALITIFKSDENVYKRQGSYPEKVKLGSPKSEILLIDGEGNIDPSTALLFEYDYLTSIDVVRCDLEPIVVENAEIVTIAPKMSIIQIDADGKRRKVGKSFRRGIFVNRSNTTVKGIKHFVKGEYTVKQEDEEALLGPRYNGFFVSGNANNVTFESCTLSARRGNGTYDFLATRTNNVVLKGCSQYNFYKRDEDGNETSVNSTVNNEYWGVGGTNFCKNMVYDTCTLTRYDAHCGLYNGKVVNSKISRINLVGAGDMLIENCYIELVGTPIFSMRADYGATWHGTVTVRNCTVKPPEEAKRIFVSASGWFNHDFGYQCYFPEITVDNLKLVGKNIPVHITDDDPEQKHYQADYYTQTVASEPNRHLEILSDGETKNENVIIPPKKFVALNNHSLIDFATYDLPFFDNTELCGARKVKMP